MYRQLYAEGGVSSLSQAKNLLQSHAPKGEHLAYINPQEAALLKSQGGSGIMTVAGIPSYFSLKGITKTIRNIIPNELATVAQIAAPFVAAGNPLAGAALAAFASFDKTGNLGDVVKSAAINYGLGQAGRYVGGAGLQTPEQGISSLGNLLQGNTQGFLTSPIGTQSGLQLGQYTDAGQSVINQMEPTGPVDAGTLSSSNIPGKGYGDLISKAGSLDPNVSIGDRLTAVKDLSGKALTDLYTKTDPITKEKSLDKQALISTLSFASSYAEASRKAKDAGLNTTDFNESIYNTERDNRANTYRTNLQPSAFGIKAAANGGRIGLENGGMSNSRVTQLFQLLEEAQVKGDQDKIDIIKAELNNMKKADGGRIGYATGSSPVDPMSSFGGSKSYTDAGITSYFKEAASPSSYASGNESMEDIKKQRLLNYIRRLKKADGGRTGYEDGKLVLEEGPANKDTRKQMEKAAKEAQKRYAEIKAHEKLIDENYKKIAPYESLVDLKKLYDMAPEEGYPSMPEPTPPEGVLSIKLTPAQKKAGGGIMNDIPMRMLHGGISEMDLRAKGGYIPYGVKEKADDVPAMLSKNEFVFTADAVRNAGGGSVNKGAQKMYKLMKSLENKKINRKTN